MGEALLGLELTPCCSWEVEVSSPRVVVRVVVLPPFNCCGSSSCFKQPLEVIQAAIVVFRHGYWSHFWSQY